MIGKRGCLLTCLLLVLAPVAQAADKKDDFVPLFNGTDLTGWVAVNNAPDTFTVRDGMIITTGIPTGVLRTERQYENFILELDWKHIKPKGNSGLFVWSDPIPAVGVPFTRAIEVQILDGTEGKNFTSDGDIFSIWGATLTPDRPHPSGWQRCLPSEKRSKPAGQWNHYRVECNDGVLKLAVNGKVVSGGSKCRPRKGYLCLEAEGSECHFRNLQIKELPSTKPRADEVAEEAKGFVSLFSGIALSGWRPEPGHQGHWQPRPGPNTLFYDGASEARDKHLWTAKEYGDFELICDWRLTGKPVKRKHPVILPSGDEATDAAGKVKEVEVEDAGDSGIYLRGSRKSEVNIWCRPVGSGELYGYRTDRKLPAEVRQVATPRVRADNPPGKWNRFIITLRSDRLTIRLNGKTVIEDAQLPGIPAKGPIGLQHHGDRVEFTNLFIRELK
jgi:hypothetical protein